VADTTAAPPTITSKNLSGPPSVVHNASEAVHIAENELDELLEASPLVTPDFLNLVPAKSDISIRWINFAVGDQKSTLRYDQCVAAGFVNALPGDARTASGKPIPPSLVKDGKIIYGDVILMKIGRNAYLGALKANRNKALRRGMRSETSRQGINEVRSAISKANPPKDVLRKIVPYVPGEKELDAHLTGTAFSPTEKI
jgi:hypothetical protein